MFYLVISSRCPVRNPSFTAFFALFFAVAIVALFFSPPSFPPPLLAALYVDGDPEERSRI